MKFLFFQIWLWLVFAFALGWFSHWFFCCRGKDNQDELQQNADSDTSADTQVHPESQNEKTG